MLGVNTWYLFLHVFLVLCLLACVAAAQEGRLRGSLAQLQLQMRIYILYSIQCFQQTNKMVLNYFCLFLFVGFIYRAFFVFCLFVSL